MQKISSFIKQYWHLFLLSIISFISHWYVFFDNKILNAGDWVYVPFSLLKQLIGYSLWNSYNNLGTIIPFAPNMVFYWFASILANILPFYSWDIFTRLFFLVPMVFLTPLFSFLLFRKIFKSDLIAFYSACIYSLNTFFLKLQLDNITYAFIWWILPALFLSILNYLETKRNTYLIYNALLVFLGFVYELRIMILVLVFLSLFQIIYLLLYDESLKVRIKNSFYILISLFLGILGHAFWLIPLKYGNIRDEVMSKAAASPFASFYDILDAFTLHMYSWSHNIVLESFIRQPIEFRHFLIPLFAIIGVISFRTLFKRKKDTLYFIFFAISLIFCIFLGKQAFEPFKGFYGWAFYNVPLFNLYRESSKFFILIALSLAFFFGSGLFYVYQLIKNYNKKLVVFVVAFILFFSSIFNLQHFIDQKIGGMVKGITINDDYLKLEQKLSTDPRFYRILWMPIKPRFGFFSEQHPLLSAIGLTIIFKDMTRFTLFDRSFPVYSQLLFLLQQNYSEQLLNNMAVKYVILPITEQRDKKISITKTQTVNAIYEHYGEEKSFIDELDKISYLEKINIGTSELVVYENENYKEHIYSDSGLNYYQTNAGEFGDFSQNQNLYLNSDIKKNNYLLDKLDNIIVPIEADPKIVAEMKLAVDNATVAKEKKKLQSDLNLYTGNLFLKDYKLNIPVKAVYKIYLKQDSVLANNKNIGIQIAGGVLQKNVWGADKEGWDYFNQIELEGGEYGFKVYVGSSPLDAINSGDIVLSAEDLAEPIKTPQLEYKQINPTKYLVNVQGATESFPLIFSESFHAGWKVYVEPALAGSGSGKFVSENNQGTIQNDNIITDKFYDLLFRKPVLNDKHFLINGFANSWWMDLTGLEKQGKISKNTDGTYDFAVYIEFLPQQFFYIGLLISSITLLGCLGYLVYDWKKNRLKRSHLITD